MIKDKRISLIIPTLNEEKNILIVLNQIPSFIDEIIVVDGYSKDDTVKIAEKFRCNIIFDDKGKGSALLKGIRASKGDYIIMMDADLSHRVIEFNPLIYWLDQGYDFCMGSRFIKGGGSEDISLLRAFGNKFFVFVVNFLFGARYTDLCYGYRSFKRDSINQLRLSTPGFGIETEMSIKVAKKKMKVKEIPSFEKKRKYGHGKLRTFYDGFNILQTILREI